MFQLSAYATLFDLVGYAIPGVVLIYALHMTLTGSTSGGSLLGWFDGKSPVVAGIALLIASFLVGMSVCMMLGGNVRKIMRYWYGNPSELLYGAGRYRPRRDRFAKWFSEHFLETVCEGCKKDFGATNGEEAYRACRSAIRTHVPQSDFDIERHIAIRSACYNLTPGVLLGTAGAVRAGLAWWWAVPAGAIMLALLAYRATMLDWLQAERVYTSYLALRATGDGRGGKGEAAKGG